MAAISTYSFVANYNFKATFLSKYNLTDDEIITTLFI